MRGDSTVTPSRPDHQIATLAARQHGLVARAQLLGAGMAAHAVDRRVKDGTLRPVHRGIYRVGPIVAPYTREMGAVLACGPGAVLSHRSAAALWGMLPRPARSSPVEVTLPRGDRGLRPGIQAHRLRGLEPGDCTTLERMPITTPARTLLDLASVAASRELERALAQVERRELVRPGELLSLVTRHRRRPGTPALLALLGMDAPPAWTRSEAEERLLALIGKGQLPRPEVNVRVEGYEVDFLWRQARVVVEVDGFAFHASEKRFENDRRRDAQLSAAGLRVMRVTWRQMEAEPEAVLVRLARTLTLAGG
jgi:very-short-patch-repair endonuclease